MLHPFTARATRARWAIAAVAAVVLAPAVASARPYRSQFELSRTFGAPMDRFGVFVEWNQSSTEYNAKFDVAGRSGTLSSDVTYEAKGYGAGTMVPRFGMTYAKSDSLLLEASVGVSFYDFEERFVSNPAYGNEHEALFRKSLQPGLAVEVGGLYTWQRFGDFASTIGVRLGYRSATKESGDDLSGTVRSGPTATTFQEVRTDELSLRTLTLTGSAGLEWRPRNTWLVNHFGVAVAPAYTFGSIEHTVREINGATIVADTSSEVDISMTPADWIGVYYGWSAFWPRVGVFSLEGQFLAEPRVTLTYEYIF